MPGRLVFSDASARQHDGTAGTVTSQMAQAAAPQQQDAIKVAVFTTVGCPHCKRAKGILQEENVAYEEVDVSTDTKLRQELQNVTGQGTVPQARATPLSPCTLCTEALVLTFLEPTYPLLAMRIRGPGCLRLPCALKAFSCTMQIFFGGKHIGGADDLAAMKREGKLTAVLNKQKGSDILPGALGSATAEARNRVANSSRT